MHIEKHIYTKAVFEFGTDVAIVPIEQTETNELAIGYLCGLLGWLIDNDYCCNSEGSALYWRDPDTDVRGRVTLV